LATLPREQMRDAQAAEDRSIGLRNESCTQRLPLLRILRETLLLLGIRRQIGVDLLDAFVRQSEDGPAAQFMYETGIGNG
jgi:hypothetical protein